MIPGLVDIAGVWKVLPSGVHEATLGDVEQRFAFNSKRKQPFAGFKKGVDSLRRAGCRTVFLDGSFVTSKPTPGDFDACWEPAGVDTRRLDPVFLDFEEGRKRQKEAYGGEFFPSSATADGLRTFVDFFQTDKYTGKEKGIIRIRLLR